MQLLSPVPDPQSFRDFYAFEEHVKAARKLRGLDMHPDWFRLAIFYFSNPAALYGHGQEVPYPGGTQELDFELEFAVIIANGGSDIKKKMRMLTLEDIRSVTIGQPVIYSGKKWL